MKGGYTDNYYMQMAQNIRRYKGVRPIPELRGYHTIEMDGGLTGWNLVDVEYRDTVGDTAHRDYKGYGGLHYTDDSGRNDIVTCKVAVDEKNVYFLAETNEALTPHTGRNWMLLLIDADRNPETGWYGYDFLVNQSIPNSRTTTIKRFVTDHQPSTINHEPSTIPHSPQGEWVEAARLDYRYKGKALHLAVPRELLGLTGNAFSFDFKWADNPTDLKDPISLCTSGDTAPNRRFNYRCIWKR